MSIARRVTPSNRPLVRSLALVASVLLGLAAGSAVAQDTAAGNMSEEVEVPDSYRKAMRSYLEAQGSFESIGQTVAYGAANETLQAIANSGVEITETMQQIVLEEALETYGTKFSSIDSLTNIWAPVYFKHFNEAELLEMTKFFKSAVGKKSIDLLPVINQDGMMAIQKISVAITPGFQLAVDARFREAGIGTTEP